MSWSSQTTLLKVWGKRVLTLLFFVVLIMGIRAWQQRDMPSGLAPALRGVLLDGRTYALPTKPARPVLVHFWATWCPVCRAEQDSINTIAHDHPDTITIAMQSGSSASVSHHLETEGLAFPVINDPDGTLSSAWGVHAVPASFILSPDGQIRFIEVGYTTGIGLRLRLWLAAMFD